MVSKASGGGSVARDVEVLTGFRVVRRGVKHSYNTGIQVEFLDKSGKIVTVRPGSEAEWALWCLLLNPQSIWADIDFLQGGPVRCSDAAVDPMDGTA